MSEHVFGWRGPSPEPRRFELADTTGLKVKAEVDPRKTMPPIFDQGQLGSCTANAICAALEHDANLDGKKPGRLSRLFLYYGEREREGSLGQGDTGAYGYDGFLVAADTGVPAEADWPYKIETFEGPVPAKATKDAAGHYRLTKAVHQLGHSEAQIKAALSNGQTVAFGFTVRESFEDPSAWVDGKMPIPDIGERALGGHEVLLIGYLKANPNYALVRNSWGTSWGLHGYFLFPWKVLLDPETTSDLRTIVRPVAK